MENFTDLVRRFGAGDPDARDALFSAAYPALRKLAHARLRSGGRDTLLETTALVHETYLKFLASGTFRSHDRRAFFAYASGVMRTVIVDAVRSRQAKRREGNLRKVPVLDEEQRSGEIELVNVHDLLLALEDAEPRLSKVVEMRIFGGFDDLEIADALGTAERTVRRDWEKARLLLRASLQA